MEKKNILIIAICFLVILGGIFLLGKRRKAKREWWLTKPLKSEKQTTPSPAASPKPLISPSPIPASSPEETIYYRSFSEAEFNGFLKDAVVQQSERENKFTEASAVLQEGFANLSMGFEKGQVLTGEIFIGPDNKTLQLRNVSVTGAEGFESLFIDAASGLIEDGLDNFIARIGQSIQIESIKIKSGEMAVYYKFL